MLLNQWAKFIVDTRSFFLEDDAVGLMGPSDSHKLGYFAGLLLGGYLGFCRERVYKSRLSLMILKAIVIISSTRAA